MKLRHIGLSTQITLGVLLMVAVGALLWVNREESRLYQEYLNERSADLDEALQVEKVRLTQSIETLRQDVLFLANTPPVSGMMRASANHGFDPRDKNPYEKWDARLQEIFAAFLRAHPDYFKVRYIGVADGGRELVRVESRNGRIEATPHDKLQRKGERDFFRAGVARSAGQVYLSEFNLNQDWGKIEEPYRPTLRAVTTILDADGRVFGVVVINKDVQPLFDLHLNGLPAGGLGYIADGQGRYLFHPDARRAFAFETGGDAKGTIGDDFPLLKPMFGLTGPDHLAMQAVQGKVDGDYLAAERIFFDSGDPSRFLLLAYRLPTQVMQGRSHGLAFPSLFDVFLVAMLVGGVSTLFLYRTFAPLRRIAAVAREIAAGNREVRLKEQGGEIGELADALNAMLDKLLDGEQIGRENAFHKAMIESLPGIFYMLDAQGRFLMWNLHLEAVIQRSHDEVAHSDPLDFFAGNERARIENAIRQVFVQGETSVDAELLARDGSKTPYHFTGRRIERDGAPVLVGLGIDISAHKRAEALLRRHKTAIETAHDGFWLLDMQGRLLETNEAYSRISGYTQDELMGMHISQLAIGQSADEVRAHIAAIAAGGYDFFETQHRHKEGYVIDLEVSATFLPEAQQIVAFCCDITRRKHAEDELRVAAAAFETQDAIVITDAQANIIRVNRAFTDVTGYKPFEVIGKNPRMMGSGRQDKAFYTAMWQQLLGCGSWAGEIWDRRKNGEIYPKWLTITAVRNKLGETMQYVAIFSDITARKQAEEEIRNLAFYDALTQLPNRRLFHDRLHAALLAAARYEDYGAVLFIDLDRFKMLNDTLGHDYGDLLLIEVAARMKSCVREMDTVARLGGDEFVVLLENLGNDYEDASHKAGMVAEKIREALAHPYQLKEHEHYSSPSIGISLYHDADETMDDVLKHADAAMYQAKNAGRNAVRFYDPGLQQDLETRATMENDLRRAIENKELHLYYQVQVDKEHRPVGVEALLRWIHPQRGAVPPAKFIPVAEDSSQILEIGNWVLETACAQLAAWGKDERMRHLTMAINISAHQFRAHDFVAHISAIMHRHGVEPRRLKLELTESVVLNDLVEVAAKMRALKELGVQLSLDDFGTGYSSLSYLKRLPLDQLKIDQSFIRDIAVNLSDAGMVQSIIDMAKNFKQDVIAEGVETEAQLAFLKHRDCMAYQGYFFSKPIPIDELEALLDSLPQRDAG